MAIVQEKNLDLFETESQLHSIGICPDTATGCGSGELEVTAPTARE
jgi:hypothetical protein